MSELSTENLLRKIKSNIEKRTQYQAPENMVSDFGKGFYESILLPAQIKLKKKIADGDYCYSDFNQAETELINFSDELKVSKLNGFDIVSTRDDHFELYEIEAKFNLNREKALTLASKIRRSTSGEGSEVKSISMILNGVDVMTIFVEADCEDLVSDFVIENFQGLGHYDLNMKQPSDIDLQNIANTLGAL